METYRPAACLYDARDLRLGLAGVLCGLVFSTTVAAAEPPPAPYGTPPLGTVIEFDDGRSCTISKLDGFDLTCKPEGRGAPAIRIFAGLEITGKPEDLDYEAWRWSLYCLGFVANVYTPATVELRPDDRKALSQIWPLAVDKSAEYTISRSVTSTVTTNDEASAEIEVSGVETVDFMGRKTPVFVIEKEISNGSCGRLGSYSDHVEKLWYAPEHKFVIRREAEHVGGIDDGKKFVWQVTRISPPGGKTLAQPAPVQQNVTVAADRTAPTISLPPEISTQGALVTFDGRISDRSRIVEVLVDGRPISMAADGAIQVRRAVGVGTTTLTVTAVDEWGNEAVASVSVQRSAPAVASAQQAVAAAKPVTAFKSPFADVDFGTYHALVIGNNDYKNLSDLKTAVTDATAVADTLKRDYKFETKVLINASRADVIDALAGYRARLKSNDNLLVYYAGHGILDEYAEEGYWLPVDAEKDSPSNWISNGDITNMVRALRAKHVMVIADSCYSGTLVRAAEAKVKTATERLTWVKRMTRKRSRTALVSGGLEPVLDGGGGVHSVFAKSFLEALKTNTDVLEAQALYTAIKRPVALESDQTPQYSDIRRAGHDGGDFLFVRR